MAQYPNTNKSLIEKVRNGDEISWNEFYSQYEYIIRSLGESASLTPEDCDDLVQCVMSKFFLYSKSFNFEPNVSRFRTYFHQIVRSQISEILKKKKSYLYDADIIDDYEKNIYEKIDASFKEKWQEFVFQDMLKLLSQQVENKTYLSFTMTAIERVPIVEVAKFLQISKDNVYVNRNRCISKLKILISQYSADDPQLNIPEDFDV